MRHFFKIDVVKAKELTLGLIGFNPVVPDGIGALFYVHLFMVSVLVIYFPFSKLMHLGGVFLSPTRNLSNDNRARRHVNPWNYPVDVHTYEHWEEEFKEKLEMAGIPLDKG
jgi:nitrate reductase gamma subunit